MKLFDINGFTENTTRALAEVQGEDQKYRLQHFCDLLNENFIGYEQFIAKKAWREIGVTESLIELYLKGIDENSNSDYLTSVYNFLANFTISLDEVSKVTKITKDNKSYTATEVIIESNLQGIKNASSTIKALLNYNNTQYTVVKTYNSITNYLKELSKNYDGGKYIDELIACIPAYDFGDKPNNFYQERQNKHLKKWLIKCAGQALGITTNEVMLLWIDVVGGAGKSYLNEWLFGMPFMAEKYLAIREMQSYMPIDKNTAQNILQSIGTNYH